MRYSKKCVQKTGGSILMRLRVNCDENDSKMKNGSHRYNINGTTPRHGHKYTKHRMCLSMMMVMCNKKHLSNI